MTWTKEDAREAGRRGALAKHTNARRASLDLSPAEVKQQSAAVQARWAAEKGSEEEVNHYFRHDVSIEDGLVLLGKMRKNCELASYALNARITADNDRDRCEFCGGPKRLRKQWALVRPFRDPTTLLIRNHYFCSIECVALMNRRNQGVYGVSDQGMTPAMNPRNHPKETTRDEPAEMEKAILDSQKTGAS